MPDARIHRIRVGPFIRSMREAPLTLTTLAALAPPELDIEFKLIDENVSPLDLDYPVDLIGISLLTGTAPRGYIIADYFRNRGIPVILGGVHVTVMPQEAARHADSIVIGAAEDAWPQLLLDFSRGEIKPEYGRHTRLEPWLPGVPSPRRNLQSSISYMIPNTVMATRGCPHVCDFCAVPAAWPGYSRRPVADVIRDIKQIRGKLMSINDVSLIDDHDYAAELFTEMIPLKKHWGGLATIQAARDPEMLRLLERSGCRYLLIGFESVNPDSLGEIHKGFNRPDEYPALVQALHEHGISVQGTFIFGFDSDTPAVFNQTVDWVNQLKVDIPRYSILTPYPGARLYQRLLEEKRILSYDWADYDTMHVVFEPAQMSPKQLFDGFKSAYRDTFKIAPILKRTSRFDINGLVNMVGNFTYRRFTHRLYHHPLYARPNPTYKQAAVCPG
jgi:radical SAM superfamily enzyme YgiQ (UPF0313 family)